MKHILTILAFVVVTFSVQGLSHFVLNVDHFASVSFMRPAPIMPLGFAVMIIQAAIISFVMTQYQPSIRSVGKGLKVSLLFGGFLASYVVLTEPAKYAVPDILHWMAVEATASTIQFLLFGVLVGYIHERPN